MLRLGAKKTLHFRCFHTSLAHEADKAYKFVVVGGGTGGLAVSNTLGRRFGAGKVAVIEPSEVREAARARAGKLINRQVHYYQPMWTLVGAGVKKLQQSAKPMANLMPPQADWIKQGVTGFVPEKNTVVTSDNTTIQYDYLVVAMGMQVNFNQVRANSPHPPPRSRGNNIHGHVRARRNLLNS